MAGGGAGTSMVARTWAVLGAFDSRHRRMNLTSLAKRADLPSPTTLRIVRELVDIGALVRHDDRTYTVGRRVWDLGLLSPVEADVREVAAPYLQDIHAATRATVHLAIREDTTALYAFTISGQASVPVLSRTGSRMPLHATGVGKVLLAHAPEEVAARVLLKLERFTAYTITAPGLLDRQLRRIRDEGVATTHEEMTLGASSVAVPVRIDGAVRASIGVVVPDFRRERARLVAALTVASRGIERALGGRSVDLLGGAR